MTIQKNKADIPKAKKTKWHQLLCSLLQAWLNPLGIEIQSEVLISSEPLRMDIIIRSGTSKIFTKKQRLALADGLSSSKAPRLLIEFKYNQSLNEGALDQVLGYYLTYYRKNEIPKEDIDPFLLSSRTPKPKTLQKFGYKKTAIAGVYRTNSAMYHRITLIVLNELSDEKQNIPLRCFASRKKEQRKIFQKIERQYMQKMNTTMLELVLGLSNILLEGEFDMQKQVITPEYLSKIGKKALDNIVQNMPVERRLNGLTTSEKLHGLTTSEKLQGLTTSEIVCNLKEDEVLQQFDAKKRLQGLSLHEIQQYLDNVKKRTYH